MESFKLGMAQIRVETGEGERNVQRAVDKIGDAAQQGCHVVLLPECLDLGWTNPDAVALAEPIPGRYSSMLSEAARANGVYVVAGLTERDGDRLFNTAVMIAPDGTIILKHRKINELSIAHDLYSIGGSLSVAETPFGIVGVNICADNSPNSLVLGHALARMGARVILSPCAWAVPSDHDNQKDPYGGMWLQSYRTLAKLYDLTVVGVSNVGVLRKGVWQDWRCIGCSLAVGPDGNVLAQGPYGENADCLITVDIQPVAESRTGTDLAGAVSAKGYREYLLASVEP